MEVPEKNRWCSVPRTPPAMKMIVANNTATVASLIGISPSRVNRNAITAVAKTSKNPSTHRCTSHQRQYSIIDSELCSFHSSAAPKNRPIATAERKNSIVMCLASDLSRSAGISARPTRKSQIISPINRNHCQNRPMSAYS